jgi:tRNA(fMet)-specific endonuclease VapC
VTRYLLDTGITSDFINRRHDVYETAMEAIRRGDRVGTTFIVLAELRAGIEYSESRERNLQILNRALPALTVWPFENNAALVYGRLWADLKKRGELIPQNDTQIAAIALSLGNCVVVTKDSDFQVVSGLKVEDWSV